MTRRRKLSDKDLKDIQKLMEKGIPAKQIAKKYGVHVSGIYRQVKYRHQGKKIPIELKNNVIKAIKDGFTKSEAAQLYGLNIGTVCCFTREMGIEGYRAQGNHIIRKNGIKLLNRLMTDGYLISDFNVPIVRNLQSKFPIIRSARYKDKTFFYLPGREEETIEAFFREKPDRVISYYAIEELSYLLGVKFSKKTQLNLVRKYNGKHKEYWISRRLIQRTLFEWVDDNPFLKQAEPTFRLMPKQGEW